MGVDTEINAKPAQAEAGVGAGAELGKKNGIPHSWVTRAFTTPSDVHSYMGSQTDRRYHSFTRIFLQDDSLGRYRRGGESQKHARLVRLRLTRYTILSL